MASTNKTTNLLLSQFLGTDHFSFLTDYNGDMLKIDTYCGNLKALIDGESSNTDKNTENIQSIQSDIESIQSVQERQNTNITTNTEDINSLKTGLTFTRKLVDRNTENINSLKDGAGDSFSLTVTEDTNIPAGMHINVFYNPQSQSLSFITPVYEKTAGTVITPINMTGRIDIEKLPETIRQKLGTGLNRTVNGGWVTYGWREIIDGEYVLRRASIPITVQLYNNGSGLQYRIVNVNEMPTLNDATDIFPKAYMIDCTFIIR